MFSRNSIMVTVPNLQLCFLNRKSRKMFSFQDAVVLCQRKDNNGRPKQIRRFPIEHTDNRIGPFNRLIFHEEQAFPSREIKNHVEITVTVRPVVEVEGLSKSYQDLVLSPLTSSV